jgi:hypothetical protein
VPIYPDAEPLLAHLRVRTYWGFAFRYPMPGESEGTQQLPTAEEIEETLRHLSDLRARLAAAATPDGRRNRRVRPGVKHSRRSAHPGLAPRRGRERPG